MSEATKARIEGILRSVAKEQRLELREPLSASANLLESGLDSLAYAILVVRLEREFGYDPFTLTKEPSYPRTLQELVALYERFDPQNSAAKL